MLHLFEEFLSEAEGSDKIERIAKVVHETNRILQEIAGEKISPHWEELPQNMKDVTMGGVKQAIETNVTAAESHDNWVKMKEADGWKYGPVKDAEKKKHPLMVPFDEMKPIDKAKDSLLIVVTNAMK